MRCDIFIQIVVIRIKRICHGFGFIPKHEVRQIQRLLAACGHGVNTTDAIDYNICARHLFRAPLLEFNYSFIREV